MATDDLIVKQVSDLRNRSSKTDERNLFVPREVIEYLLSIERKWNETEDERRTIPQDPGPGPGWHLV